MARLKIVNGIVGCLFCEKFIPPQSIRTSIKRDIKY